MSKRLLENFSAEQEANEIASQFMDSSDVVGDMSRAFGQDFSSVRIHTGEEAAQRVADTGADAFAEGKDIFFGRGVWNPNDRASRGLLAHELTHTMQQSGAEGVQESAPTGEMQGGILDWFRSKFSRKKKPQQEMQISGPLSVERNTSQESEDYMRQMRGATMTADMVNDRMPQLNPGQTDMSQLDAVRATFEGNEGAIAASNQARQKAIDAGQADSYVRSAGLQGLALRNSSSAQAQADKGLRGSLITGFNQNLVDYMKNLEAGGMDFSYTLNGTQRSTIQGSPGSMTSGGNLDGISQDLLTMFSGYLTSDQSIEYLSQMSDMIKGADVFGGDKAEALQYMLQTLLTSAGSAYLRVGQSGDIQKKDEASLVARESMRTLLMLPSMKRLSPEAMQQMPQALQDLLRQYNALTEQIHQKMGLA